MKLPKLKKRLLKICELVEENKSIVDVGCDHGYVAVYLAATKKPKNIIASDLNLMPLEGAVKTIKMYGAEEKIEARLSNGLRNIKEDEADVVIIAGMGGELISDILKECKFAKNGKTTFLLQPMTAHYDLRKYLLENKFEIIEEFAVSETGKLYTIIKTIYTGVDKEQFEYFYHTGKHIEENDKISSMYLDYLLKKLSDKVIGAKQSTTEVPVEYEENLIAKIKEMRECNDK